MVPKCESKEFLPSIDVLMSVLSHHACRKSKYRHTKVNKYLHVENLSTLAFVDLAQGKKK